MTTGFFRVQIRECGKWRTLGYNNHHATIDAAETMARRIDQDGMFRSDVRIVQDGVVILKGKNK